MNPASRTPEGQPNRCPVCGKHITLEPSHPPGDAPCPYCNSLVWFDAETKRGQTSADTIERTKQQIRLLVAEIAMLSTSDLDPAECYRAFLPRVVQALAAVGGAVWLLDKRRKLQLECEINVPRMLLDIGFDDAALHYRFLEYVIATNHEQLVPPLSGAVHEQMGGNPTRQLLLLNPLQHSSTGPAGVVEIFQRPNTSPATQRGYSIFLKQMCEFGSTFLGRAVAA